MVILQVDDDARLHGLPVASESNVFPTIPDTDSFLLIPKSNEDSSIPTINHGGLVHHSLMIKDHDTDDGLAIKRFSAGNVSIPYTNVKILSWYLAANSNGSYHDYGMININDDETDSSAMKTFNDTLGEDHLDVLWNTAETLLKRRKKMSDRIRVETPTKVWSSAGNLKTDSPSSYRSEIGVALSPKPQRHASSYSSGSTRDDVSSFTMSENPSLSNLGLSSSKSTSQLGVDRHKTFQNSRTRSVSVSKAENSPCANKFHTSSSSKLGTPKPKKFETLVSPVDRRGISMSKLATSSSSSSSSSVKDNEGSTIDSLRRRSTLTKGWSDKEDGKMLGSKKLEALVLPHSIGRSITKHRTEEKRFDVVEHNNSDTSSPTKHKFLRRQTISKPLSSSTKNPARVTAKKVEAYVNDDTTEVVKAKITSEKCSHLVSSSSTSTGSTMKILKRAKYIPTCNNLRRTRARSSKSGPREGSSSEDFHNVVSSMESCETDLVHEQKAEKDIQKSKTSTRRRHMSSRTVVPLSMGDQKDEQKQPKKVKVKPGRMIEFKYEIASPRRLKFKRRTSRNHDNSSSSLAKVDIKFEVLKKAEILSQIGETELTEEVDVAKQVDLKEGEMHPEKIISEETTTEPKVRDRKSKVKALVGAFESLITIQDSNSRVGIPE